MPKFYMLIGVPGAGKSTWLKHYQNGELIVSSDYHIEKRAEENGTSYNAEFADMIKIATAAVQQEMKIAFAAGQDVILDQTNISKKSRAGKLQAVPKDYEKIAVFFPTPEWDEHQRRLDSRPGKSIPWNVLNGMIRSLEEPSYDEGFDEIITA
jgi:predicted kinase